jgi:hypothetical protein
MRASAQRLALNNSHPQYRFASRPVTIITKLGCWRSVYNIPSNRPPFLKKGGCTERPL